jgi:hypothetical protein
MQIDRRPALAHRVAWQLAYGAIPVGMLVCHRCDVPACVRVSHLFLGTAQDNTRDMMAKNRQASNPLPRLAGADHPLRRNPAQAVRGEAHGRAKLTADAVRAIRARYATGDVLLRELATEFDLSVTHVHAIVTQAVWRHV